MADRNVSLFSELGPTYYVESDQSRDVTLGAVSYNETQTAPYSINLVSFDGVNDYLER